jgi:hypothetical protein
MLTKGQGTIRANVTELMGKVQSQSRMKAISTIARKNNISIKDAQFRQAVAISKSLNRK